MNTDTFVEWAVLATAVVLVSWTAIAAYIVVTDWRERRRAQYEADLRRWRQTVDSMRRLYEQDRR